MSTTPQNATAEQSVLGGILLRNDLRDAVSFLEREDFFEPAAQECWEAAERLQKRGTPIDEVTLAAEVQDGYRGAGRSPVDATYINQLALRCPTEDNLTYYAHHLRELRLRREFGLLGSMVANNSQSGAGADVLADSLRKGLAALDAKVVLRLPTLQGAVAAELDAMRNGECDWPGLPTGLGLERVVPTGIPRDKVTTIFGETGTFKSTLKNHLAWTMAAAGHTVIDVSFEDSRQLTAQRYLATKVGVGYGKIAARDVPELQRRNMQLTQAALETAGRIITVEDCEPTMEAVTAIARQYKRAGAAAVFVDYLQLLDGKGEQREILNQSMRQAQLAARQDNMGYVLVSQVKQEVSNRPEKDGGPRPCLEDCLGSSAVKICTKLGLGIFRPYTYCRAPVSDTGYYGIYRKLVDGWPAGPEVCMKDIYPRILEIWVRKNIVGETPVCMYALLDLPTGRIEPFDIRQYL